MLKRLYIGSTSWTNVDSMSISIFLVDDHQILRDGLCLILQKQPDFHVVGAVSTVAEALGGIGKFKPDLTIMDVHLPDGSGLAAARSVLAQDAEARVLVLSGDPDMTLVHEALRMGVRGYLLKDEAADELVRAVRQVMNGHVYLCPSVSTLLAQEMRNSAAAPEPPAARLSERETEVLQLIAQGLRNKEMAVRLGVTTKSVETYRARLLRKTGCASTAELVRYAVREGLAQL